MDAQAKCDHKAAVNRYLSVRNVQFNANNVEELKNQVGESVVGVIQHIAPYGVFIRCTSDGFHGLAHRTQIADLDLHIAQEVCTHVLDVRMDSGPPTDPTAPRCRISLKL